ncbi:MAG: DUF5723 family protein [Bacteroidota bacterium]
MLVGQNAATLRFQPQQTVAQFFQPALLADHEFKLISVGAGGLYGLGSNVVSLDRILVDGNFLNDDDKDRLVAQLGDDNRFQIHQQAGAIINFRVNQLPISLSLENQRSLSLITSDPNTIGLLLYGNARYAGQTIGDPGITARDDSWLAIGLGTAYEVGKLQIGTRLKFLLGQRMNSLENFSYDFFTAEDGSQIDLSADYELFQSQNSGNQGTGFGVDLGFRYKVNDKLVLDASVINLGVINWKGTLFDNAVSFSYEGFDAGNVFSGEIGNLDEIFALDTLEQLVLPDSANGTYGLPLPISIHAGAAYSLSEKASLFTSLHIGANEFAAGTPIPMLNVAYQYQLSPNFLLGGNVFGGGMPQYGFGVFAQANFALGEKQGIALFYSMDNALGLIAGGSGRGLSMHGGLSLRL